MRTRVSFGVNSRNQCYHERVVAVLLPHLVGPRKDTRIRLGSETTGTGLPGPVRVRNGRGKVPESVKSSLAKGNRVPRGRG